jgi:hypothetical protein
MFTLTCATDNLLLTRKRCGLVVDKSIFAGINVNDEIVEINHFRVESLTDGALQQQLSLPMISLLILPNDEEQLIKVCLKANDLFVKKSRNSNTAKVERSSCKIIRVCCIKYLLLLFDFVYFILFNRLMIEWSH